MAETIVKKRGPKKKEVAEGEKQKGLPTTGSNVTPAMVAALEKCIRTYDAALLIQKAIDKGKNGKPLFSAPVIRNFLKTGFCTENSLWNFVVEFVIERNNHENEAAAKMLQSEVSNVNGLLELLKAKQPELRTHIDSLLSKN